MITKGRARRAPGDPAVAVLGRQLSRPTGSRIAPTSRKRPARCPPRTLVLLCHLRACLLVLLGVHTVDALLPVFGRGNSYVTDASAKLTKRGCGRSSCGSLEMGREPVGTHLSPPVLELITPDGCASSSPSEQSSLIANVQKAVAGGVSLVQLRDYKSSPKSKAELSTRLAAATEGRALFVVNGEPEAARASGADGVHLPERMIGCLPGLRGAGGEGWPRVVGCSVHSVPSAVEAARLGADYVQVVHLTGHRTNRCPLQEPQNTRRSTILWQQLHIGKHVTCRRSTQKAAIAHSLLLVCTQKGTAVLIGACLPLSDAPILRTELFTRRARCSRNKQGSILPFQVRAERVLPAAVVRSCD